jgi:hypothetical protein
MTVSGRRCVRRVVPIPSREHYLAAQAAVDERAALASVPDPALVLVKERLQKRRAIVSIFAKACKRAQEGLRVDAELRAAGAAPSAAQIHSAQWWGEGRGRARRSWFAVRALMLQGKGPHPDGTRDGFDGLRSKDAETGEDKYDLSCGHWRGRRSELLNCASHCRYTMVHHGVHRACTTVCVGGGAWADLPPRHPDMQIWTAHALLGTAMHAGASLNLAAGEISLAEAPAADDDEAKVLAGTAQKFLQKTSLLEPLLDRHQQPRQPPDTREMTALDRGRSEARWCREIAPRVAAQLLAARAAWLDGRADEGLQHVEKGRALLAQAPGLEGALDAWAPDLYDSSSSSSSSPAQPLGTAAAATAAQDKDAQEIPGEGLAAAAAVADGPQQLPISDSPGVDERLDRLRVQSGALAASAARVEGAGALVADAIVWMQLTLGGAMIIQGCRQCSSSGGGGGGGRGLLTGAMCVGGGCAVVAVAAAQQCAMAQPTQPPDSAAATGTTTTSSTDVSPAAAASGRDGDGDGAGADADSLRWPGGQVRWEGSALRVESSLERWAEVCRHHGDEEPPLGKLCRESGLGVSVAVRKACAEVVWFAEQQEETGGDGSSATHLYHCLPPRLVEGDHDDDADDDDDDDHADDAAADADDAADDDDAAAYTPEQVVRESVARFAESVLRLQAKRVGVGAEHRLRLRKYAGYQIEQHANLGAHAAEGGTRQCSGCGAVGTEYVLFSSNQFGLPEPRCKVCISTRQCDEQRRVLEAWQRELQEDRQIAPGLLQYCVRDAAPSAAKFGAVRSKLLQLSVSVLSLTSCPTSCSGNV